MQLTMETLEHLREIKQQVDYQWDRWDTLHSKAGIKNQALSGMPHGNGVHDRIAENIPLAVDLERDILKQINELYRQWNEIDAILDKLPIKVQLSCSRVGSGNACRVYLKRFLKKLNEGGDIDGEFEDDD